MVVRTGTQPRVGCTQGGPAAAPSAQRVALHTHARAHAQHIHRHRNPGAPQVADAKHPSIHQELRELVTFRGPVDSVYKAAPSKVSLDNGSGEQ